MGRLPGDGVTTSRNRTFRLGLAVLVAGGACLLVLLGLVAADAAVPGYSVPDAAWEALGSIAAWMLGAGGVGTAAQGARHVLPGSSDPPPEVPS